MQQLQEAPGRSVDNRCLRGAIEHGFVNFLLYNKVSFFVCPPLQCSSLVCRGVHVLLVVRLEFCCAGVQVCQ